MLSFRLFTFERQECFWLLFFFLIKQNSICIQGSYLGQRQHCLLVLQNITLRFQVDFHLTPGLETLLPFALECFSVCLCLGAFDCEQLVPSTFFLSEFEEWFFRFRRILTGAISKLYFWQLLNLPFKLTIAFQIQLKSQQEKNQHFLQSTGFIIKFKIKLNKFNLNI